MIQKMLNVGSGGGASSASEISFDNENTSLSSQDVQSAIEEVNSNLSSINDNLTRKPITINYNPTYSTSNEKIQNSLVEYDGYMVGTLSIWCDKTKPSGTAYVTVAYLEDTSIYVNQIYANCKVMTTGVVFGDFRIEAGQIQVRANSQGYPTGWMVLYAGQISPIIRNTD